MVTEKDITYGSLIVLGTNGNLPSGCKGRRKNYFTLKKRTIANGVKPSETYLEDSNIIFDHPSDAEIYHDQESYSASYEHDGEFYVVPYFHDENTDMFQIGRSTEKQIDFVLMDILPGSSNPNNQNYNQHSQTSTISRHACRIVCDRTPPYTARIYAACFNFSKNIDLSEKAPTWFIREVGVDGMQTNGVLILQNGGGFNLNCGPRSWMEISVCGKMHSLRRKRSAVLPGQAIEDAVNILKDGTLIDLGGVTLLWRSRNESDNSLPPFDGINNFINDNALSLGNLSDLAFPNKNQFTDDFEQYQEPWVYLGCGHVHGWTDELEDSNEIETLHICPECRLETKHVPLLIGQESAFYIDSGHLSHCFVPCGHACSIHTARYWWGTKGPQFTRPPASICPFCATPLENPGCLKLVWLNDVYTTLPQMSAKSSNNAPTSLDSYCLSSEIPSSSSQSSLTSRKFFQNQTEIENVDLHLENIFSPDIILNTNNPPL